MAKRTESIFGGRTAQYRLNPVRNEKGQLKARKNENVDYNSKRDDKAIGVKSYKGDNVTAKMIGGLTNANENRRAEIEAQKNQTRNGKGRFIGKADKQRNARNARSKQSYDIKRAFGMSVG